MSPITNQVKGYPFEVALPAGLPVTGVILADLCKSLDWGTRRAEFMCTLPQEITDAALDLLAVLLEH